MVESKFSRRQLLALLAGGVLATLPASCSPGSSNDSRLGPSGHVDGEALHYASLRDVARLIETKQVSPVELTRMMLDRIAALDRRLKSYATVTIDHALAAAHAAEQEVQAGSYRGPLHGVPIAVKDLCYTKGVRTMGGLGVLADVVPDFDATVVSRLEAAGAVILGKLVGSEGYRFRIRQGRKTSPSNSSAKQLDAHEASKLSSLPIKEKPLTEDGVILGTLQYMAPEQLEGKEADARTDIFAFGSLLYEMVTGKKVFDGKSQASLISAIMSADPRPLSELQPLSPPALDRVVNKCLAKDGDDRWQTSLDLRDELQWIREGNLQPAGIQAADTIRAKKRGRLAWVAALITSAILAGMAVWGRMLHSPEPPRPIKRFAIPLPPDVALPSGWGSYLALSPDGTQLAFVGNRGGVLQLFLRSMEQGDTRAMPGTEGARHPAFSADGDTIAFDVRGRFLRSPMPGDPRWPWLWLAPIPPGAPMAASFS